MLDKQSLLTNAFLVSAIALASTPFANAAIVTTGDTSLGATTYNDDITTGIVKVGAEFSSNTNLSGTLEVNGGSVLTSKDAPPSPAGTPPGNEPEPGGMIGRGAGSVGTVTVTGAGSEWRLEGVGQDDQGTPDEVTFGPYVLVGRDGGVGTLNVEAGGKVILDGEGQSLGVWSGGFVGVGRGPGGDGSVLNISGPGSEVIIDNIDHTLFRMGGKHETSEGSGVFEHNFGEVNITNNGKLTVTGNNSLIQLRNGVANVNTGGSIETNILNIGDLAYTNATLNLDGSTSLIHITGVGDADSGYNNAGYGGWMTIGGRTGSQAVVNVTGGAKILIDDGTGTAHDGSTSSGAGFSLGGNNSLGFGGEGVLNVDGDGSALILSSITGDEYVAIGRAEGGGGTVNVTNGGKIEIKNNNGNSEVLMATTSTSGTAVLNVDGTGSLFDAGNFLGVGATTGLENTGEATVTVANGGTVMANEIGVGGAGIIQGNGTLVGNVSVNPGGTVAPGLSPGTLTIDGDFDFTDGVLEIEIAGEGAGQYDVLNVIGDADLTGGTILFSFLDGFLPEEGLTLEFLTVTEGGRISDSVEYAFRGVDPSFELMVLGVCEDESDEEGCIGEGGLNFLALNDAEPLPPSAVPLPAAAWLFLSALGLLGFLQKRKVSVSSKTCEPLVA